MDIHDSVMFDAMMAQELASDPDWAVRMHHAATALAMGNGSDTKWNDGTEVMPDENA